MCDFMKVYGKNKEQSKKKYEEMKWKDIVILLPLLLIV